MELKDRRLKAALAELVMSSFDVDGLICNDVEAIKQAIIDGSAKTVFAYYQLSYNEKTTYQAIKELCKQHDVELLDTLTGQHQGNFVGRSNCLPYFDEILGRELLGCKLFAITDSGTDTSEAISYARAYNAHYHSFGHKPTPLTCLYCRRMLEYAPSATDSQAQKLE